MTSCAIESVNFTDCQFFVIVHYRFTTSCTDVETKQHSSSDVSLLEYPSQGKTAKRKH